MKNFAYKMGKLAAVTGLAKYAQNPNAAARPRTTMANPVSPAPAPTEQSATAANVGAPVRQTFTANQRRRFQQAGVAPHFTASQRERFSTMGVSPRFTANQRGRFSTMGVAPQQRGATAGQ